jgi:hypothetical protein
MDVKDFFFSRDFSLTNFITHIFFLGLFGLTLIKGRTVTGFSSGPSVGRAKIAKSSSFAAFFLTDHQSPRIDSLRPYLVESRLPPTLRFDYFFVNYTQTDDSVLRSLYPPDEYRSMMNVTSATHKSRDLGAKFFFAIRYFLESTDARWFFRGIDDTFINFMALPGYVERLEERFDPRRDFVFRGNCVTEAFEFPQGGSGYVISRAAARVMAPHGRRFLRDMHRADDLNFRFFLAQFGVNMTDITDEAFCGHYFGDENIQRMRKREYSSFDLCPTVATIKRNECRPFVSPVRDIVFYHEWNGRENETIENSKHLFSSDPVLQWWMPSDSTVPRMCRSS